jgi:hypothetical protein
MKYWRRKECQCGCGGFANPGRGFINGHGNKNRRMSEEIKRKLSLANSGEKHPMYGKHISEETKGKIGASNRGKIRSKEMILKMSLAHIGNTHNEESKRKISISSKNRIFSDASKLKQSISLSGENGPGWIDGRSYGPYGDVFKEKEYKQYILERDEYKCQCPDHNHNKIYHRLDRHHIDFDKTNSHPMNLISLCVACHLQKAHKKEKYHYREIFEEIVRIKYQENNIERR